jgi:hypothetical protein
MISPSSYSIVCCQQHPSASVSIRQHTSAYVGIRQHPSASVSIRHHIQEYAVSSITRQQRLLRHYLYVCTSKASKIFAVIIFNRMLSAVSRFKSFMNYRSEKPFRVGFKSLKTLFRFRQFVLQRFVFFCTDRTLNPISNFEFLVYLVLTSLAKIKQVQFRHYI